MARLVVKKAQGPKEIKPQKQSVWICMCGLSKNQPFCDSSHKKTLDEKEGKVYVYDEKGKREEINDKDCCENKDGGCCGGCCCQDNP